MGIEPFSLNTPAIFSLSIRFLRALDRAAIASLDHLSKLVTGSNAEFVF
jgi:hypothetical protein